MPKESKWTHPTHARGVQSPRLDVRGGKLLSDKQIDKYAREGRYGTEIQDEALGRVKTKKRKFSAQRAAAALLERLLNGR
jgi:hypothetical protein